MSEVLLCSGICGLERAQRTRFRDSLTRLPKSSYTFIIGVSLSILLTVNSHCFQEFSKGFRAAERLRAIALDDL